MKKGKLPLQAQVAAPDKKDDAGPDSDALLAILGRRARRLRTEHHWTLRELSQHSGLSPRFLVQVESGRGNISVRKLTHLAGALGTTPSMLLSSPVAGRAPLVALLGMRGAGKSTLGRKLARRLKVPFVELDHRVEETAGLSLGEIFAMHGESYFRRLEKEALERILNEGRAQVVATGGGLVTSPEVYASLRERALTVWLKARAEDHWNRVLQQGDRRPMADNPQAMADLRRLLTVREPLYARAHHTIDTSDLPPQQAVQALADLVKSSTPSEPA